MKVKIKGNTKGITLNTNKDLLIPAIEGVLNRQKSGEDRKHGWNSPSSIGNCLRQSYFSRIGVPPDFVSNDPRLQRIFDNGTCVHIRLQDYLKKDGVLLLDEAPVVNTDYQIIGTTDGLLLDGDRLAVLEIKSIFSIGFSNLKDAKPEHKLQAGIYLYCLNEMRKACLKGNREILEEMYRSRLEDFLKDGKHKTKEEKVEERMVMFQATLDLLEKYPKPLKKTIFLYENKDTQELKEFTVEDDGVVSDALNKFTTLNNYVDSKEIPPMEKTYTCSGCKYRKVCKAFE